MTLNSSTVEYCYLLMIELLLFSEIIIIIQFHVHSQYRSNYNIADEHIIYNKVIETCFMTML